MNYFFNFTVSENDLIVKVNFFIFNPFFQKGIEKPMSLLPIFIRDVRKECMYNKKSRLYWIMTAKNFVLMRCVSLLSSQIHRKEVRVMFMSADLTYHCLHMRIHRGL